MRLVQLTVPTGARDEILECLDERGIDYVQTEETSGREYAVVVYFPLPSGAVESVLDELQSKGIEEDAYTVVLDAETVVSRRFEELQERYDQGDVDSDRISRQELEAEAKSLTPAFGIFATMTVLSALVATAGLLLDSPAVVVGSMVIAPLIGPAMGASVGSVIDDEELFRESMVYQLLGVVVAIGAAAIFAWLMRTTNVVPPGLNITEVGEIEERLTPDLLSLVVALGAGVAGIVSIATQLSVALVGVMIAAALIPPAAAAGIAIAWGNPTAAIGSTALVFVNLLSVNLAGLVTLWYAGYRPENFFDIQPTQKRVRRRILEFGAVVLLFSALLGGITYGSYQNATFEQNAREDVQAALEEEGNGRYELLSLEVEMGEGYPIREPEQVIVTVGGPPDEMGDDLAERLQERIERHADGDVDVEVRYVDVLEESE
ncbi:TIGR00341 family protein [Natrialbaceae archaeon GCM10025810]|uniref:TIGR00341 family protein n=1 Tax=Halovalidus salilacus TaxID=3075124 RepID=UPI0036084568